jgi:hypothetical protein
MIINAFYTQKAGAQNRPMSGTTNALTLQLLEWISDRPRTHEEVLEAWRTSCPRLSIWEDACLDGLIDSQGGGSFVTISGKGRQLLQKGIR